MIKNKIKAVVLDFGGVLVEIHGQKVTAALQRAAPLVEQSVWNGLGQWLANWDVHHEFERGKITSADFCEAVARELKCVIDESTFTSVWNEIFGPVIHGIPELLEEVSQTLPLYLLSNTNHTHWQVMQEYPFMKHFTYPFASFLIGARKPDREAFAKVIEAVKIPANNKRKEVNRPENCG